MHPGTRTRANTVKTEPSAFQMPHLRSHPHVLAGQSSQDRKGPARGSDDALERSQSTTARTSTRARDFDSGLHRAVVRTTPSVFHTSPAEVAGGRQMHFWQVLDISGDSQEVLSP